MLDFKVNEDRCTKCGDCIHDCPVRIIEVGIGGIPTIQAKNEADCMQCQHCLTICPTGAVSILGHDPDRSALGIAQRKWLFSEFEESTAAWRFIAGAFIFGTTWKKDLPESTRLALVKTKLVAANGQDPSQEQWDGYPAERYLLLRKMRDHKLHNFVILSSGANISLAQEVRLNPLSPASRPIAVECVDASVTSQNFDDKMKWPPRTQSIQHEQELLHLFPDMKYLDLDSHGYSIVDVTPERVQLEWWNVETVTRRTDKESRGAAFQIDSGSPALIPIP